MKLLPLLVNRVVIPASRRTAIAVAPRSTITSTFLLRAVVATRMSSTKAGGSTTTIHSPQEIEEELQVEHNKAAHAFDESRGDYDAPKSKEEMAALNALYHRIDALETELQEVKTMVRDARRIYAVDAPDGESDDIVKETLEEVNHIIEDAAKIEDVAKIKKQHQMETEVKKFHARDPEHDW